MLGWAVGSVCHFPKCKCEFLLVFYYSCSHHGGLFWLLFYGLCYVVFCELFIVLPMSEHGWHCSELSGISPENIITVEFHELWLKTDKVTITVTFDRSIAFRWSLSPNEHLCQSVKVFLSSVFKLSSIVNDVCVELQNMQFKQFQAQIVCYALFCMLSVSNN